MQIPLLPDRIQPAGARPKGHYDAAYRGLWGSKWFKSDSRIVHVSRVLVNPRMNLCFGQCSKESRYDLFVKTQTCHLTIALTFAECSDASQARHVEVLWRLFSPNGNVATAEDRASIPPPTFASLIW